MKFDFFTNLIFPNKIQLIIIPNFFNTYFKMLSNSLKDAESEYENMSVYYSYIKGLVNVNQALTCEVPDREAVKVKIDFCLFRNT